MELVGDRDELREAAERGEVDSMKRWLKLLMSERMYDEAEQWAQRLVEAGDAEAMYDLALLLRRRGDVSESARWLRQAVELGNVEAMFALSYDLRDTDPVEAEAWARKAAEAGNLQAMHGLGTLLKVKGDLDGAEQWYRKAGEAGNTYAMNSLGELLEASHRDQEAEEWYARSADSGSSQGMVWLGVLLHRRGATDAAMGWWGRAAEAGDAWGFYNVGATLLERGQAGAAEENFVKAAEGGVPLAMTSLGTLAAEAGDGDLAASWYMRAVDAGDESAQSRLDGLNERRESTRLLDAVRFDTFGWEQVSDEIGLRQWRSDAGVLSERFMDEAPDLPSWNEEKVREAFEYTQEAIGSPDFDLEEVPEAYRDRIANGELPEDIKLLDVGLFEAGPAKCVLMTNRHRAHGSVHYSTMCLVLFAECFWAVVIELEESADVGEREGAVARAHLELPPDAVGDTTFDPYESKWDGIVPLEDDPLARLRLLTSTLAGSITIGKAALSLAPFTPGG